MKEGNTIILNFTTMKVSNLKSPKGNDAPNQFLIENVYRVSIIFNEPQNDLLNNNNLYKTKDNKYQYTISSGFLFQSYESLVCFIDYAGRMFIDERYYKYSKTTSKYLSIFLKRTSKEIEKEIKEGKIRLCEIEQ